MDEAIGPQPAGQAGGYRHHQTHDDHQPQVVGQAQVARSRNGPRRGGHEVVRGVQAGSQRHAHGDGGDLQAFRQRFLQRVENDVAGITEHRNGDDGPDDGHGERGKALSQHLDDRLRHDHRRASTLHHQPDDGAEHDDQADAAQDAAEAGADRVGNLGQRHAIEEGREERGQDQHQERVPLQLRRAEDNERDDDGEPDDRHDPLFFGNCRVMTTIKRSNDESKPRMGLPNNAWRCGTRRGQPSGTEERRQPPQADISPPACPPAARPACSRDGGWRWKAQSPDDRKRLRVRPPG